MAIVQGKWRFYTDATPDGSMTALAAENTKPTLTQSQMENGKIRLRFQLHNNTGTPSANSAISFQFSEDGTNWKTFGAQNETTDQGIWFWAANGAATEGNAIGSRLLTGTDNDGIYLEQITQTDVIEANAVKEFDFAVYVHWPPPSITTIHIRVTFGGATVSLDSGAVEIQLQTPGATSRSYTIDRMTALSTGAQNHSLSGSMTRMIHYGEQNSRWWAMLPNNTTVTQLDYYYWTGSGVWSSKATTSMASGSSVDRLQTMMKTIAGNDVVMLFQNESGLNVKRGVAGTTTISWGSQSQIAASSPGTTATVGIDDGNYWWVGGCDSAVGVWAYRSTNADQGSSWTSGWGTLRTLADSAVVSLAKCAVIGLASNKMLMIWASGNALKWSLVTDAGFVGINTLVSTANDVDWGVVRSGGYVYLVHTDSTGVGGNWVLRVFNESNDTWSLGTSPGVSGQVTTDDGMPLTADGDNIYAFGTFRGAGGGMDRIIRYKKYTGPGASGSWDGSLTTLGPDTARGNCDELQASSKPHGSKIVCLLSFCDCSLLYESLALEYHTLDLIPPTVVQLETA